MTEAVLDVGPILTWASGLLVLIGLGTAVYRLLTGPARRNAEAIEGLHTRLGHKVHDHQDRIAELERMIAQKSGRQDMHELQMMLTEMHGAMREIRAEIKGSGQLMTRLESVVTRHEEHLLARGQK